MPSGLTASNARNRSDRVSAVATDKLAVVKQAMLAATTTLLAGDQLSNRVDACHSPLQWDALLFDPAVSWELCAEKQ